MWTKVFEWFKLAFVSGLSENMKLLLCQCVNLMNPATVGEKGEANHPFNYSFFRVLFQNVKCLSSLNINCVNFVNMLLTIGCSKYRITARGKNQAVFMKNSRVFFAFSWLQTNVRSTAVAPAPISSRFLCPRPPFLLSAPNQNRHATQATKFKIVWL